MSMPLADEAGYYLQGFAVGEDIMRHFAEWLDTDVWGTARAGVAAGVPRDDVAGFLRSIARALHDVGDAIERGAAD